MKAETGVKLRYGLKNGQIKSIYDISIEEKGLKCGCVCPACGMELQARIGKINQRHFAHKNKNCNIATAQQTAMHIRAKEIIYNEREMLFPEITLTFSESSVYLKHKMLKNDERIPKKIVGKAAKVLTCDRVILEKKLDDIVPDIAFYIGNQVCLIEIAVTHFIDKAKLEKIKKLDLPVLEIDLRKLCNMENSEKYLRKELLYNPENRYWVHYPNMNKALKKADDKFVNLVESIELENENKRRERQRQLEENELLNQIYYKKRLIKLRNDEYFNEIISEFHFSKYLNTLGNFPYYLDIPITGEIVISCDRRIWQSAIFDKFIYSRKYSQDSCVKLFNIKEWSQKHQTLYRIDWHAVDKELGNFYEVVQQYLEYLGFIGFISEISRGEAKVIKSHTLLPPNQERSKILEEAIEKTHPQDKKANRIILDYIYENYGLDISKKRKIDREIMNSYVSHWNTIKKL